MAARRLDRAVLEVSTPKPSPSVQLATRGSGDGSGSGSGDSGARTVTVEDRRRTFAVHVSAVTVVQPVDLRLLPVGVRNKGGIAAQVILIVIHVPGRGEVAGAVVVIAHLRQSSGRLHGFFAAFAPRSDDGLEGGVLQQGAGTQHATRTRWVWSGGSSHPSRVCRDPEKNLHVEAIDRYYISIENGQTDKTRRF